MRIDFVGVPFFFPIAYNTVHFSVVDDAQNNAIIVWRFESTLKPWGYLIWPLLRIGFGVFVGQIIDELKFYLENDAPHPRKVKANEKAQAKLR